MNEVPRWRCSFLLLHEDGRRRIVHAIGRRSSHGLRGLDGHAAQIVRVDLDVHISVVAPAGAPAVADDLEGRREGNWARQGGGSGTAQKVSGEGERSVTSKKKAAVLTQ